MNDRCLSYVENKEYKYLVEDTTNKIEYFYHDLDSANKIISYLKDKGFEYELYRRGWD